MLLRINGRAIDLSGDLPAVLGLAQPGDPADIDVWRRGARRAVHIILDDADARDAAKAGNGNTAKEPTGRLGLALRAFQPAEQREAGLHGGLVIERVSGAAARAGVQAGDVLLAIDGQPVSTVEQASAVERRVDKAVAILVLRDGAKLYVALRIG